MNGGQKYPTAGSPGQMLPQPIPAFHLYDTFVADEVLGRTKQFGKLVVQVGTVGYEHNRRTGKFPATHQHTAEKQHCDTLPASGSSKVGTTFSVAFLPKFGMLADMLKQLVRGKELRIAANHFLFVLRRIGEEHKVLDYA